MHRPITTNPLVTNRFAARALATTLALAFAGMAPLAVPDAHANDTPKAGSDQPVTDTWITTKVKTSLATTEGVKSTDIDVKTVDGVVTLSGTLASADAVEKAIAAAESVKGVRKVEHSALKSQ